MNSPSNLKLSLADLLGHEYIDSVCRARAFLTGESFQELGSRAREKVDCFAPSFQQHIDGLLDVVGSKVSDPFIGLSAGAPTSSFREHTDMERAPLSGLGIIRVGEDGRAYLAAKSEHYHASLGHGFPGFRLIEIAKALGIAQITHNNTRGYITRQVERELVSWANVPDRGESMDRILSSRKAHVLNRVCNLQTGSLATEAAVKMMLARFYTADGAGEKPAYENRHPVFLVVGDEQGQLTANYHGTTILTQMMRGLWPGLASSLGDILTIQPVGINDIESFKTQTERWDKPPYKVAGFLHEIVLMNYGAIKLEPEFLAEIYHICHNRDIPVMVDEIQSCAWSPALFLYREYGLQPDFVAVGKGLPGGQYADSRIITTAAMDNLSQFGALVTNGQQELGSLAYLVTMAYVNAYGFWFREVGEYYHKRLRDLAERYKDKVSRIEGLRHMGSIHFHSEKTAVSFVSHLRQAGVDISVQTYKAQVPPAALTKLPLTTSHRAVDFLADRMADALSRI